MTLHRHHQNRTIPGFRYVALLGAASLVAAGVSVVSPAYAAAPPNDEWSAATPVEALRYKAVIDTTEATTDAVTPPHADWANAHSVWWKVTLKKDRRVVFSTRGTEFRNRLRLYHAENATDTPGSWKLMVDDGGYGAKHRASFMRTLTGGETYFVMLSSAGKNGGIAKLRMRRPARLTYSLARDGVLDRVDGTAVIHGTIQTSVPTKVDLKVQLRQRVGDHVVDETGYKTVATTTKSREWKMRISGWQPFKLGQVRIVSNRLTVMDEGVPTSVHHFAKTHVTLR